MKKESIELTKEQRAELEEVIKKGTARARKIQHAHVLLKIDSSEAGSNWSDQQVKEAFEVSIPTIWRIRQRFLEQGLNDALNRRPQPERPEKRKIDGEQEAHVIAVTCSQAPEGYKRWSMRLLADKLVELGYFEKISHDTVWVALKKINSSHG
jgi:transposase